MKIQHPSIPKMMFGVLSSVCVFIATIQWGFWLGEVKGSSMEPYYHEGDPIIVKVYPLLLHDPKRNDVVVLKDTGGFRVIKRIILVPGDFDKFSPVNKTLSNDEFVVLGDNRDNSCDSREYGPVKRKQIIGIVN